MIHQMLAPPAETTSHALPSFGDEGNAASPEAKETTEGGNEVAETRTAAPAPAPITFGGLTFGTVDAEVDIPEVEPVKGEEPEPINAVPNQPSPPNQEPTAAVSQPEQVRQSAEEGLVTADEKAKDKSETAEAETGSASKPSLPQEFISAPRLNWADDMNEPLSPVKEISPDAAVPTGPKETKPGKAEGEQVAPKPRRRKEGPKKQPETHERPSNKSGQAGDKTESVAAGQPQRVQVDEDGFVMQISKRTLHQQASSVERGRGRGRGRGLAPGRGAHANGGRQRSNGEPTEGVRDSNHTGGPSRGRGKPRGGAGKVPDAAATPQTQT